MSNLLLFGTLLNDMILFLMHYLFNLHWISHIFSSQSYYSLVKYIHIHSTDPVSASNASEYETCQLHNDKSEMLVNAKRPISVL
jgi:hypothetical protein